LKGIKKGLYQSEDFCPLISSSIFKKRELPDVRQSCTPNLQSKKKQGGGGGEHRVGSKGRGELSPSTF